MVQVVLFELEHSDGPHHLVEHLLLKHILLTLEEFALPLLVLRVSTHEGSLLHLLEHLPQIVRVSVSTHQGAIHFEQALSPPLPLKSSLESPSMPSVP